MTTLDFYLNDVWKRTLDGVYSSHQISESMFNDYLLSTRLTSLDDDYAYILCPTYIHFTIVDQYREVVEFYLEQVLGKHLLLKIQQQSLLDAQKETAAPVPSFANRFIRTDFSDQYTFTNFVVGRSNAQAQVASLAVSVNPGLVYNPLFIYGNSGLGKTHLLLAIGNKIREVFPAKKIAYISGPDFVEGVYHSIKEKKIEEFKLSFQELDVLLIDDIQFIAGKEKTHEVFFSVFNDLVNNRKQICLTADRTPSQIKGLEDRIISRFNQGLNVNIEAPEYETCVKILETKISNNIQNPNIDEDVISYIATNFNKDVRQLEGALTRLLFYAINFAPEKEVITLDVAVAAFQDTNLKDSGKEITIDRIKRAVGDYYGLTVNQLNSKTRTKNIAMARHIAMYLCRKMLDAPYKDIGVSFGNRDHSTVINACDKVEKNMKGSAVYQQVLRDLESRI